MQPVLASTLKTKPIESVAEITDELIENAPPSQELRRFSTPHTPHTYLTFSLNQTQTSSS
ncbi:unnamed protein product [Hymenolepis diminuta]|uniref:Uncharacterized protein n=1 Tax=Hymenolepis diminuta TaxID=6216 RepID=A0A564Z7Q3_HYMDI|nr:unnamed protein product [Hymenolepis diminuta]